ncbi:DEAD/DEAH box helicase [Actinomyces respiraculi]|uniref:DEAD/DEAH box helicase n=1 Tax=Actinomyces respiraculi TaxID=2744574 RepID=UPI0014206AD3|nr:DEAD/DEAH box helicase [Actinomyces respiraculi]
MAREITEEDWPAQVSDEQVVTWAGGQTFLRGRRYADEGRVLSVSVSAGGDILMAQVRGSGRTYQTMLHATGHGEHPAWSGSCSCPVRTSCKHAVALLLTARSQALASSAAEDWQAQLDELLHVSERPARSLALEVAEDPRGWSHALTLLPLIEGRRGWNRRGASWSTVLGGGLRDEVIPEVLEPVQEIGRMSPAGFYYEDERVSLDDVPPRVWDALRRALDAGLTLTTAQHGGAPVIIQSGLRAGVSIERQEDGSLIILPEVDVSQVEALRRARPADGPALALEPVGQPVHAFAASTPDGLILMPVEPAPDEVLARLLVDCERRVVVPEADVPRFESEHMARLMRAVPVLRVTEGVVVPEATVVTPVLQVTVDGTTHRARTDWRMRYLTADGELRREVLLGDLTSEGDDAAPGGRERPARAGAGRGQEDVAMPPTREISRPVARDLPAERRAAHQAFTLLIPLAAEHGLLWHSRCMSGIETARFVVRSLPVLEALDGLEVEVVGEVPDYRAAEGELVVTTQVSEEDRPDWFSLRVRVHVGEDQVPIERLIAAVANGDKEILLDSGAWIEVDRPEVHRLAALMEQGRELAEPHAKDPGAMSVTAYQAGYYAQLVEMGVVGETAQRWRESVERLLATMEGGAGEPAAPGAGESAAPGAVELAAPKGLRASLRPYQHEGYRWLHLLRSAGLGGVLADDMGLGKTVQVLAEVQRMAEETDALRPPVLVVAPTSVVGAWVEQARRFCPDLDVRAVTRTRSARGTALAQETAGADVVVTSYTIVRLNEEDWAGVDWSWVVLDEAQFIKNHASATYRAVRRLRTPCALVVTGTPLENSLMDLWSLLSVSAPGLLPGPERFNDLYRRTIERGGAAGSQRLADLRRRIGPFMLRRTKEQVAVDLPVKTEQILSVELSPAHRRAYELRLIRERQKVMGLLEDDTAQARFSALRSLTILRQMALDPELVAMGAQDAQDAQDAAGDEAGVAGEAGGAAGQEAGRVAGVPGRVAGESARARRRPAAKAELLLDTLRPIIAEGHKALVFSQFTRYLRGVQEVLTGAGLRVLYLDGSTTDRDTVISRFRAGEGDVFLISLKAGGFGLTLTEADYVFLLDPWWNPQVEEQAVDRVHRIGQDRPVLVYRLVCAGTIEEKVMALKEKKADLFARVIEGGEAPVRASLTAEEIRDLLAG